MSSKRGGVVFHSVGLLVGGVIILVAFGFGCFVRLFPKVAKNPVVEETSDVIEEVLKDETGISIDLDGDGTVGNDSAISYVVSNVVESGISKVEEPAVK